jgi:hypothetical protein
MFDRCLEIHKRIGCTGRARMEVESKKFYSNISRPIIEIFLKYSEEYQANVMLLRQKKVINSFKVGDLVFFCCSDVDRGAADPENLLCIIIEHIENSIQFRLGCKAGIFDQTYPFNSFTKTELVSDFKLEDIPDKTVTVRKAISLLSLTGGQGVKKCNCRTSDCNSGRCSCKVANRQCNSKCHGGNANNNCYRICQVNL